MQYELQVKDRYKFWEWSGDLSHDTCTIDPIVEKFFNKDVIFIADKNSYPLIVESPARKNANLCGVLLLDGKTYGRHSNNKLLYKCLPNDTSLPPFLIPYKCKPVSFSKTKTNIYIIFSFKSWTQKHPIGLITQTLGPITDLKVYCEYRLFCKKLQFSITNFNKQSCKILKFKNEDIWINTLLSRFNIEDRREHHVITIDPAGSKDLDDAIGLKIVSGREVIISVYIANVSLWIEILHLWDSFSQRTSTIYLPSFKKSMIPSVLSENICSLLKNKSRPAFTMDVLFDTNTNEILEVKFLNTLICVRKNYVYEDPFLVRGSVYLKLMGVCDMLHKKQPYIENIKDSHDLVAYLMILMNHRAAIHLKQHKNGIFRNQIFMENTEPQTPHTEITKFIKLWKFSESKYCLYERNMGHSMIGTGLEAYTHITSPIRRLVDLLNMIQLQKNLGLFSSTGSSMFLLKWANQIENINKSMKDIRRVQNDCLLLHTLESTPELLEKTYTAYLFDKTLHSRDVYQYNAYLPELKLVSKIKSNTEFGQYHKTNVELFLFVGEESIKRKIRLELKNL
jgi:exoribonuclease R